MPKADLDRERDRAWYAIPTREIDCTSCGDSQPSLARSNFNAGFNAGASWSIRRTSEFSPHIAKFVELITWLAMQDTTFKDRLIEMMFEPEVVQTLKHIVLGEVVDGKSVVGVIEIADDLRGTTDDGETDIPTEYETSGIRL